MTQGDVRTSPFQPLSLSSLDTNQLQVLANTILNANLDRYQRFLDSDKGKVNSSSWKLVKTTHRTRVYLERQHRPSFTPFQVDPAVETSNSVLQPMLCVGSTSGRLDDVMLGIVNPPSSCVNDLSRATVLSTLKLPTTANPFRTVEAKWMEMNVRSKAVPNHDYIYVEATGTQRLPNGQRVGYHLLHSVEISEIHELPRTRSCTTISVLIFPPRKQDLRVSLRLGDDEPMDDRVRRVVMPHFVNTLLSTFKRAPSIKPTSLSHLSEEPNKELKTRESSSRDDNCVTCSKRSWRLGKTATCNVCSGCVCSSCKVLKELSFMTPELEMTQRNVVFCSSCVVGENLSEFSFAETASCTSSWGTVRDSELALC